MRSANADEFQWSASNSGVSEKESDKNKDLGEEMADVLWVLICLANQTGVNLTEAFQKNLEKKTIRDKDRHHQNPKLK